MITVKNIYDQLKEFKSYKFSVYKMLKVEVRLPNGKFVPISKNFDIEDNVLYLYCNNKNDYPNMTCYDLEKIILRESLNECWFDENHYKDCFDSLFYNCEVKICYTEDEIYNPIFYELSCIAENISQENEFLQQLTLKCKEPEDDINITLTEEEVNVILYALNFVGDFLANHKEYSCGEKYWNLKDKIKDIIE